MGMTGPIGHGKTTLAKALVDIEPSSIRLESSMIIAEVANTLHSLLDASNIPNPYDIDALNSWLQHLPLILTERIHASCRVDEIKIRQQDIERHPIEYQKLIIHVENLQRNPKLLQQKITPENKERFRPFLQFLGGYLVKHVDSGIWYKELVRRIHALSNQVRLCIIGGLRFPNDATILRSAGATIVKVYRPGHLQNDMLDPTERERDNIPLDCTIMSDGDIDDIRHFAKQFYADLQTGQLQKIYRTRQ